MLNRRLIGFIALFCCFFKSYGENVNNLAVEKMLEKPVFIIRYGEMLSIPKVKQLQEKFGKPVFSFTLMGEHLSIQDQFCYTTELSRILLVGEPRVFERVRRLPLINVVSPVISLAAPLFDNRFESFIKNAEKFSQKQLQEAIQDAILLSPCNTKAYSANKLLNALSKALQNKIAYTKDQIKHNYKWDQKTFSSLKKSGAWAIGLTTLLVITNKYIDKTNIANKVPHFTGSDFLEFLNAIAVLGLLPVSYKILKNCYKILTIRPYACNQDLYKYEELLAFVQKLKAELETNGLIAFELTNGLVISKDNELIFN